MKKYIILVLALMLMSACDYEKVNTDVYGVTNEELGVLRYGARFMDMVQLVIPIGSPSLTTTPGNHLQNTDLISSGNYVGYFGNNNNWNMANEANWNFTDSRMKYAYGNFYSNLFKPWNNIYSLAKESSDPYEQAILAIANIVKVLGWLRATDAFGPIVYTKAGAGDIAPALDGQEVVYKNMLADLDNAVKILNNVNADVLKEYDLIYSGNVRNWIKLANSLILRMAVRVHFQDEVLAKEYLEKALDMSNGGVIESKEEEAKIQSSDKMPLLNSMMPSVDEYKETRMGATIWAYLNGYEDPRMGIYFTQGTYNKKEGYYFVVPTNKYGKKTGDNTPEFASRPNVNNFSPLYWFRASEVCFLKAEAALYGLIVGDAKSFYEQGVKMSFSENGATGANEYLQKTNMPTDITAGVYKYTFFYRCQIADQNTSPKWDHFNEKTMLSQKEQQLQKIITQKYLALYPNAIEAWTEYRRTGYPFLMKPFDEDAPGRIGAEKDCLAPERFRFAPSEYIVNPNMSQVPALLGGPDMGNTKLWWVRKDRPKQP